MSNLNELIIFESESAYDFAYDLPMYLRLVTETYDWNPVPADGGLTGSFEERTTKYDWVRTWKLIDN